MADTPNQTAPAAPTQDTSQQSSTSATPVSADQAAQTLANPNATPAQKVQAVKKLKSLSIKVDGQDYNEVLPFELDDTPANREYMTKQLQLSKVAHKRMGEKSQLESNVNAFLDMFTKNPRQALKQFNIDEKALAASIIEEEIANSQKSPELLAKEALEAELRALKEEREKEKKGYDERERERLTEQEYIRYDTLMSAAIEKSDLPKSPYVVKKMTDYMILGVQNNLDFSPEDVLPLVREEILDDIRQMSQAMPIETLEKLFGGDILSKIRKNNVKKVKSGASTKPKLPDVGATAAAKPSDAVKKKSIREMWGV